MKKVKNKKYCPTLILVLMVLVSSACVSEEATPFDSENNCWGEREVVDTSLFPDSYCGGAITLAKDDQGDLWLFDTTCLPGGFTAVNSDRDILFAPPCSETE